MKKAFFFFYTILFAVQLSAQIAEPGKSLPAWQNGYLDIHHINTGRGNAAYCIFPDGTTLLIDAGELSPLDARTFTPRNASIKPDSSRKPYEWIVNYIRQVAPAMNNRSIDYALITHFHDDHFGAWYPAAPMSASGDYSLTGITGIAELLPIHTLIDRGNPEYIYPYDFRALADKYGGGEIEFSRTMHNYFSFLDQAKKKGMTLMPLHAGSNSQIKLLRNSSAYTDFHVRNIKSNQWIWTGKDSSVINVFPGFDPANRETWPDENSLSLALTIQYGPFLYYTGGDNAGNVFWGDKPWRDTETPIAKAVGETDVATMDHHGNRDAVNEYMVSHLKPRVWIGQSWSADHPGHEVLVRMTTKYLYNEPRDLFATNMLEANKNVIGPLIDRSYKSLQGHIVVRVMPGGMDYYVIVLDDSKAAVPVSQVLGPYKTKKK